jgi:hypothetical protein
LVATLPPKGVVPPRGISLSNMDCAGSTNLAPGTTLHASDPVKTCQTRGLNFSEDRFFVQLAT